MNRAKRSVPMLVSQRRLNLHIFAQEAPFMDGSGAILNSGENTVLKKQA